MNRQRTGSSSTVLKDLNTKAPPVQSGPIEYVEVREDARIDTNHAEHIERIVTDFSSINFTYAERHYFRGTTGVVFAVDRSWATLPFSRSFFRGLFQHGTLGDYAVALFLLVPPMALVFIGALIDAIQQNGLEAESEAVIFSDEHDLAHALSESEAENETAVECLSFDHHFVIQDWQVYYNEDDGVYAICRAGRVRQALDRPGFTDWLKDHAPYALSDYTDEQLPEPL